MTDDPTLPLPLAGEARNPGASSAPSRLAPGDEPEPPAEHRPQTCRSCGQPIWWARNIETGKAMPVDVEPTEGANVVLYRRGTACLARVLKKGELPAPGEKTRLNHFVTCPNREQHRRSR